MNFTINEIKEQLKNNPSDQFLAELAQDSRAGAKKLWQSYQRQQEILVEKKLEFEKRFTIENSLKDEFPLIAGIDEVGRGPLAGPVISAAVILKPDFDLIEVNDSKQLTDHKRRELFIKIIEQSVSVGIGVQDNQMIDQVNIYEATRLAMRDAVLHLTPKPDYLLVDAMNVPIDIPQQKLIKGDAKSNSIAAASIVAKVIRDQLMATYNQVYPGFFFDQNAGYGTKLHLSGLKKYGATPIHRRSFKPVDEYL